MAKKGVSYLKEIKRAIEIIVAGGKVPTTEGAEAATEGEQAPPVPITTSTNPTNPRVLASKPRTHLKMTRANTPGTLPQIVTEEPAKRRSKRLDPNLVVPLQSSEPNSSRIPLHQPNIITQAAVDAVTYCKCVLWW